MPTWLVPVAELTVEQLRAIELPVDEHKVIIGGPGSGKTMVLLHRAKHLATTFQIPPGRFRIFVFTNVLSEYIRSAMDLLSISHDAISTFDDWCRRYHELNVSENLPWDHAGKRPDFNAIRGNVFAHREKNPGPPLFDFILVDEAQDLAKECFDFLRRIAAHVTICMDHNQKLYDNGSDEQAILHALSLKRQNLSLLETFRCCPFLTQVAAEYIADQTHRQAFLRQTRVAQTDIETPLLYEPSNFDDEKRMLVEMIKLRVQKGERIAVLLPLKRQVFGFAKSLREAGLEIETQDDLDFTSDTPKLITYHSAKGLTFDSVLLPRLTPKSFPTQSPERIERLLFVALTRATRWAYLSSDGRLPQLERLAPLVDRKIITLQKSASVPSPPLHGGNAAVSVVRASNSANDDLLDAL